MAGSRCSAPGAPRKSICVEWMTVRKAAPDAQILLRHGRVSGGALLAPRLGLGHDGFREGSQMTAAPATGQMMSLADWGKLVLLGAIWAARSSSPASRWRKSSRWRGRRAEGGDRRAGPARLPGRHRNLLQAGAAACRRLPRAGCPQQRHPVFADLPRPDRDGRGHRLGAQRHHPVLDARRRRPARRRRAADLEQGGRHRARHCRNGRDDRAGTGRRPRRPGVGEVRADRRLAVLRAGADLGPALPAACRR